MKKYITILLLSFFAVFISSYTKSAFSAQEREIYRLLKKHSPTGYYIVSNNSKVPDVFYVGYDRKSAYKKKTLRINLMRFRARSISSSMLNQKLSREAGFVMDLNMMVHETSHMYTTWNARSMISKNGLVKSSEYWNTNVFYMGGGKNLLVKIFKVFPSKEIMSSIPKRLRTFRFPKYINSKSRYLATQTRGIFGLLDEFHAYYHGTKTAYDFLSWFKKQRIQDVSHWDNFFSNVNGTLYAHQEFKFFMISYLLYAKEKHPEIYDRLVDNKNFKSAFRKLDLKWKALVKSYQKEKPEIFRFIQKKGITVTENKKWITFKTGKNRGYKQSRHYFDVYTFLQKELEKAKYRDIREKLNI